MAITVESQILGQELNGYKYLYEPFNIVINETDLTAKTIFIALFVYNFDNDHSGTPAPIEINVTFGRFDLNPGKPITVDINKMLVQKHRANVYKNSNISDIVQDDVDGWDNVDGWKQLVTEYSYRIRVASDVSTETVDFSIYPIIGGRDFENFNPIVDETQILTEFDLNGIDISERWLNYPYITQSLTDLEEASFLPTIESTVATEGKEPKGGYLIWKSRYGGWMSWGMDIAVKTESGNYVGSLDSGLFDVNKAVGGNPFIAPDYTKRENSYSYSLKALDLENIELSSVAGIVSSPVVYYMKSPTSKLELMRLGTVSAPVSTNTDGDDFSVTLNSISKASFKTR